MSVILFCLGGLAMLSGFVACEYFVFKKDEWQGDDLPPMYSVTLNGVPKIVTKDETEALEMWRVMVLTSRNKEEVEFLVNQEVVSSFSANQRD